MNNDKMSDNPPAAKRKMSDKPPTAKRMKYVLTSNTMPLLGPRV
jgi:hypothetical protein